MIFDMNNRIIPYEGIGELKLGMRLEDIRRYLKNNQIKFDQWINQRLQAISARKELTDEWNERGVKKGFEYAILTDEINGIYSI